MNAAHDHTSHQSNGKGHLNQTAISDLTYTDLLEDEMAGTSRSNVDERIAEVLEGMHTLTLEIRASALTNQQKDKTALPNWLMPILCTAFIGLVVWSFTTVVQNLQKENEKLEIRMATQETYMKNTREQLIAHGWTVDDQGNVRAPAKK